MSRINESAEFKAWSAQIDRNREDYELEVTASIERRKRRIIFLREQIESGNWEYTDLDPIDYFRYLNDELIRFFLSDKYRTIKIIVIYGMSGDIIRFCPDYLLSDKDVVYAAVKSFPQAIEYVNDIFKSDIELAMHVLNEDGSALQYFNLKDNEDVAFVACQQNGEAYEFLSPTLKKSKLLALTALKSNTREIGYRVFAMLDDELRADKDCIITAIQHYDDDAYWSMPEKLRTDPDILKALDESDMNFI